jgi:tetratricopeptide (TPR) repeat protein
MSSILYFNGYPQRGDRWVAPAALGLVALLGWRTISHAGFWTHLASGRWMARHGLPSEDPLTVVSAGAVWTNPNWLYDRCLFSLWEMGGAGLVTFVHVLVVVAAFWLVARVARGWASAPAIGLALLLNAWLLAPRFEVGPDLLGLIFPAFCLWVLAEPRRAWLPAALLLPAQWLWANLNASFLWGPLIALLFAVQYGLDWKFRAQPAAVVWRTVALAAGMLVVSLWTPYGASLFRTLPALWAMPEAADWISPLGVSFPSALARNLVKLVLAIGAAGLLLRKERLPVGLTSLAILCAYMMVRSMQAHSATFALIALPFIALSIQAVGAYLGERLSPLVPAGRWGAVQRTVYGGLLAAFALSVFTVVTNRYYVHTGSLSSFGPGAVERAYPAGIQAVLAHPQFPETVLNLPVDGGYLAWAHPGRRAFIDQRTALHGAEAVALLTAGLLGQEEAWSRMVSEWAPQAVILNMLAPVSSDILVHLHQHRRWALLYFDGTTAILLADGAGRSDLMRQGGVWVRQGLEQLEAVRQAYRADVSRWRRAPLPPELAGAAVFFQGMGLYPHAAACYELLVAGAPNMQLARLHWGVCLAQINDYERAVQVLASVVDRLERGSQPWYAAQLSMGLSFVGLEHYPSAIRHLRLLTETVPDRAHGWLWLWLAYNRAGQAADAKLVFERGQALDPELAAAFRLRFEAVRD